MLAKEIEKLAQRVSELLASDPQFREAVPDRQLSEHMVQSDCTLTELMCIVCEGYSDRPALGQRARQISTSAEGEALHLLPRFDTISYRDLWRRVDALSSALADAGVHAGDRIAIHGFPSVDYTTVDMAIPVLGAVAVPLHDGAPIAQLQPMVDETEPSVMACSADRLGLTVTLAMDAQTPRLIVLFDVVEEGAVHREALESARCRLSAAGRPVEVVTLADLVTRGVALPAPPSPCFDDERLAAIIYTSGSSGSPKGAMQPEGQAKSVWAAVAGTVVEHGFAIPAITLNYLPMSHTGGRAMLYSTLGAGGTAYFTGASDMSTILDDLQMVRPTQLNFVPRVWEMLYRDFSDTLGDGRVSEDEVLADWRSRALGGRYVTALTGSAPISADLAAWVEKLLDSHLIDAMGATESGAVLVDGQIQRPPVTDYKLVDVPELGYFSTDRPHPRGELLIKSRALFSGYYRRPALTAAVFDEQGFYRTGDIVAQSGPDQLRFIERRNNVIKLSQGEFVTISTLESIYVNCELVQQIYIYGSSEQAYLLAVVVPSADALAAHRPDELKEEILRSLRRGAHAAELEPYEIPRDILVEPEPFSLDNGLLSGIGKPSRPKLRQRYGEVLERLYAQFADEQSRRLAQLKESATDLPTIQIVRAAAAILLGISEHSCPPSEQFTNLGGDSLSALTFARSLKDIVGVDVPVGHIVSPAADLQSLADYIDEERRCSGARATFDQVHTGDSAMVSANELTLEKLIDADTLQGAPTLASPTSDVRTVLITGATGFLGRYLMLDWLHRMSKVGGRVICPVRARDDAHARARLDAVIDSGDSAVLARYRALAAEHLEVLAADKAATGLGLDEVTWQRLADTVDLIVDSAALVNHLLPYQQLFGPNVTGTAELIRLALTSKQKPIAFVSTIGVAAGIMLDESAEDADVRRVGASRRLDNGYASGYSTSKWAAEVLLREAHDLCGLPVTVYRCDMIMAECTWVGQLNIPDAVTRLILSVALTGLAPRSFYAGDSADGRPRAHFDGLPVDFVTEAITTLASRPSGEFKGFQTFHVMNPHDDGIGLDQFVDWLAEAGCRIERIADYPEWLSRFETALRNLPERQRQASLLPVLDVYRHPQIPINGAFCSTRRFQAAVAEAGIGVEGAIPHIDAPIVEKYLCDLEFLGLLDSQRRGEHTDNDVTTDKEQ
ncbi:carboxylic acid reductase [Mycobacterium sp. SMC-4]|uniref:carboxylic acid reductase n=1 Tax=Mycobacterium sp. SMC-4 TaxID=2857059 RepID=UPI0037CBF29B